MWLVPYQRYAVKYFVPIWLNAKTLSFPRMRESTFNGALRLCFAQRRRAQIPLRLREGDGDHREAVMEGAIKSILPVSRLNILPVFPSREMFHFTRNPSRLVSRLRSTRTDLGCVTSPWPVRITRSEIRRISSTPFVSSVSRYGRTATSLARKTTAPG